MALLAPNINESLVPVAFKWTLAEYERLIDSSVFDGNAKVELIGGEITEKMSPQNNPHGAAIVLLQYALIDAFHGDFTVRVQLPLVLAPDSEPEPDVAVVAGNVRTSTKSKPTTAVLVAEIADSSLALDRDIKAGLYARAGVQDYWIVNLRDRTIEIYRNPAPTSGKPFGHHYGSITVLNETQSISPLAAPDSSWTITDLLPDI